MCEGCVMLVGHMQLHSAYWWLPGVSVTVAHRRVILGLQQELWWESWQPHKVSKYDLA